MKDTLWDDEEPLATAAPRRAQAQRATATSADFADYTLPDGTVARAYAHGSLDVRVDGGDARGGDFVTVASTPAACEALAKVALLAGQTESGCRCPVILVTDPTRHFQGCPRRLPHPVPGTEDAIYVIGSSHERLFIQDRIARLRAAGWRITHDWTTHKAWDSPYAPAEEVLIEAARVDLDAVRAAGTVWYLAPYGHKSEGSATEIGVALILGKRVVVSGALDRQCIFPRLGTHRFPTHDEALAFLIREIERIDMQRAAAVGLGDRP